ncbi:MAG: hypothetical protein KJ041_03725, partial [Gammaproteobacteria bacterium]|nr:hypothetical protein [Gammaproteobacteria bacterium]
AEHLRGALDLTANRCYETINPLGIQAAPGGDYWVTVAPADGQFDESFQEGGGADQLVEDAGFTITAYVRVALDETGHDGRLLHDPNRGLLTVKKKLLAALADVDLMTEAGDTFLRSTIKISSASKPEVLQENRSGGAYLGVLQIQCRLEFDWDLS